MILSTFLTLLPVLLGMLAAQPGGRAARRSRALVVQDEVILRVPVQPAPSSRIEWVEHKGPKCIPAGSIRGALLSGPSRSISCSPTGSRIRAEFDEDCPALDFYGGFYLQPQRRAAVRQARRHPFAHGRKLQDRAIPQLEPKFQALAFLDKFDARALSR